MPNVGEGKVLMKTSHLEASSAQPGGVVVKHSGLWTRRQEFESLPGYSKSPMPLKSQFRIFLHKA
jgi:hypothetical protein